MNRKYFYIIPLFLVEIMVQMLFFWLATEIPARWVVYVIVTVMTMAHLTLSFVLTSLYGIRKTAATLVAGSVVQILIVAAAVLLFVVSASVRSAFFLLLILSVLYITVVSVLGFSMESRETDNNHSGIHPIGTPGGPGRSEQDEAYMTDSGVDTSDMHRRQNADRTFRGDSGNARRTPPPLPVQR